MTELDITYKIIVLKVLSRSDFALTNAQVVEFFLENEIADYFTVQDAIAALKETGNIIAEVSANQTFYRINETGENTLSLFTDHITEDLSMKVDDYFKKHGIIMKEENSLISVYFPTGGGYICQLKKTEEKSVLIDLSLYVSDKAQAQAICTNWKVHADEVYDSLMDILV